MTHKLLALVCISLSLIGCTGTQVTVKPDPMTISTANLPKHDKVGVRSEGSQSSSYGPSGNMTEGFAQAIREHGFAKEVAYPLRPDENVNLAIDTQFTIKPDLHSGAAFAKGFFVGLTLFLIEPIVWFDQDYVLEGSAVVTRNGQRGPTVTARTDATISSKWLSLGQLPTLEVEAITKAKKSLYLQLMREIR